MYCPASPFCVIMLTLNWCGLKIYNDTDDLLYSPLNYRVVYLELNILSQ